MVRIKNKGCPYNVYRYSPAQKCEFLETAKCKSIFPHIHESLEANVSVYVG